MILLIATQTGLVQCFPRHLAHTRVRILVSNYANPSNLNTNACKLLLVGKTSGNFVGYLPQADSAVLQHLM